MMDNRLPDNAHDLDRQLDRAIPPHTRHVGPRDPDALLRAAQRVARGPDAGLSGAALDRIEARLRTHMDAVPPRIVPPIRHTRRRVGLVLRYAAMLALVLALMLTTVVQAAAASLPGDTLYPVKRAVEGVRLALVDADEEAALRVSLAARRVGEFEALLADGRVYPRALEQANEELAQALDLLAAGHGDWAEVDVRLASLTARQSVLLEEAVTRDEGAHNARLAAISDTASDLQQRMETLAAPPVVPPDVAPTPTPTMLPTATPTPSLTPTITPSPSPTPTRRPAGTPTHAGGSQGAGQGPDGEAGASENGTPPPPGMVPPDSGGNAPDDGGGQGGDGGGQGGSSGRPN